MKIRVGLAVVALMLAPALVNAQSAIEKNEITVGLLPTAEFLPAFVAQDQGFLAEEGLKVTSPAFQSGPDVVQALIGGALDIAAGGGTDALIAISTGRPIKTIWELNSFVTFSYVAKPEIKSWKDMKGKAVAISSPGSQTDLTLRWVVKKQGMDPDTDLRIVAAGSPPGRLAALKSGAADAAVLTEPLGSQTLATGYSLLTRLSDIVPKWPSEVFFTSEAFIKKNPETIKAYLRAISKASKFIATHEKESIAVLRRDMKLSEADAKSAYNSFKDTYPATGEFSIAGWDFAQELMLSSGALSQKVPYDKVFDMTFVNWAKTTLK